MKKRNETRFLQSFLSLFLVFASAGTPLSADVLTPHAVARLRSVGEAAISPDGEWIAYTLNVPRVVGVGEDGPAFRELHVVGRESGRSRPFVTGTRDVHGLAWTPDGKSISFLEKPPGGAHTAVHAIPLEGGEARQVVGFESDIEKYSWSPDGKKLAFIAEEPESDEVVKLQEKGFKQLIYEEDWRPRRIYVADAFSSSQARPLDLEGAAYDLAWSPVDGRLAVALAPRPLTDDSYMFKRIRIVEVDSGRTLVQVANPGKLGAILWSPDGKRLAFISAADLNDPMEGRLAVADASTGEWKDVLGNHAGHVESMAWLPPDQILFVDSEGVWTSFEKVSADGAVRKRLVAAGGPILRGLTISRDGLHAAFVADSPQHPGEVYAASHEQLQPRRLTDSNPWLKDIRLAPQEVARFKARDGVEIEGILIRPLEEKAGQRYPLVLYVHGGPEGHHSNGWLTSYSSPGQMAAAEGMAVFHTNYRGSTGRGVEFSKLSQGDPAGKEFDDLADAVDYLVGTGLIDPRKVGVTGGSYGGYATAWCSTFYSEKFAAGVMFVGISDKISKLGTTDIPEEEFLVHARLRPWDDWEKFLHHSPIYYADKGRTPLLILHGTDDPRVNVGQSRELYRHLKLRGQAPVRLVLYPGERHGNRKSAARLDYSLRMMRWLRHYLTGPGGEPPEHRLDYGGEPGS